MEDKELRERIAEYICGSDKSDPFHKFDISNSLSRADQILAILKEAGYRKIEGEPPLLGTDAWEKINRQAGEDVIGIIINLDGKYTVGQQMERIVQRCNLVAQAQRDADMKHYEREE